ncbi:MAG: type IX secretion system protein PorQ [Flavobacteriaceae bacterium]|jgi:hypothetical protein|nr:type IX secretion system protein PorQ [Flavobacteriaceae bacterium]
MRCVFLFLLLLLPVRFYSQIGGDTTYKFLNLPVSPMQSSLGGKNIVGSTLDVTQPFMNPATTNSSMSGQLALNFSRLNNAVNYGSAAYVQSFDSQKNIFVGVNYLNYGQIEGYDEFGFKTGNFTGNEVALSIGSSYNISYTDWYVGANTKFIFSSLAGYTSFGMAFDLGVLRKIEQHKIDIAFVVRNLGGQIDTYAGRREKLPLDIAIAISKQLENVPLRLHLTIDNLQQWNLSYTNPNRSESDLEGNITEEKVSVFNNALRHMVVGVELFPEKKFNLRVGYNFRKGEEMKIISQRHFAGFMAGFGFRYNRLKLDYSYARQSVASNTSMFGVVLNMN